MTVKTRANGEGPAPLVDRRDPGQETKFRVGGVLFGGADPVMIAGPCSVETEARTLAIAEAVRDAGAQVFRAGAFKPRTSPYSFQGLKREGLHTLQRVRSQLGMPVVTEVVDPETVEEVAEFSDLLQVGARNMQNYSLLDRLGRGTRPVLLKRGLCATLEEWLMAAEYILAGGNEQVVLVERGIRTHSQHSRNTLDLNVVPAVRERSHLPILVDPSHGVGHRSRVRPMARAALAAGAQGLLVEVHSDPEVAYSDGHQTLSPNEFAGIVRDARVLQKLESCEPSIGAQLAASPPSDLTVGVRDFVPSSSLVLHAE